MQMTVYTLNTVLCIVLKIMLQSYIPLKDCMHHVKYKLILSFHQKTACFMSSTNELFHSSKDCMLYEVESNCTIAYIYLIVYRHMKKSYPCMKYTLIFQQLCVLVLTACNQCCMVLIECLDLLMHIVFFKYTFPIYWNSLNDCNEFLFLLQSVSNMLAILNEYLLHALL